MVETIVITQIDAEAFARFKKYQDLFLIMEKTGVFDIQFGKATLNYAFGQLQNVTKEEIVYKKT